MKRHAQKPGPRHLGLAMALGVALGFPACDSGGPRGDRAAAPPPAPVAPRLPAFAHPPMSPQALIEHVRVLASDAFEGRGPGTNGERLTLEYMQRAFAEAGLLPGNNGSFLQPVPLISATLTTPPTLTIKGDDGARTYAYATQFSAWTKRVQDTVSVEDAELVFVGYGITAPELGWDDYAGADMHGKIAVILINDPDCETGDDRGFAGRAMTYYGRWTYKYEEAARKGAAGALIIHEAGPAAYPWAVIESSTRGPRFDVVLPDRGQSRVGFEGWIQSDVAMELFRRAGLDFNQSKARAQQRGMRPVRMGSLRGSIKIQTHIEQVNSNNVVGILRGRVHPDEYILYSAHWDHLGRCAPVFGDDICNGAVDNASGSAGLVELARRFAADGPPERSVVFLSVTAEEQGLLGSLYYSQHPIYPAAQTVAAINMDGLNNVGLTRNISVIGWGKSDMDDLISQAARAQGRRADPEEFPERGNFYRSDHINFARIGVPSLYAKGGTDLVNGGEARGRQLNDDYIAHRYHKPQDQLTADWDMTGGAQDLLLLYNVGRRVADSRMWPAWRENVEFRAAREASRPRPAPPPERLP